MKKMLLSLFIINICMGKIASNSCKKKTLPQNLEEDFCQSQLILKDVKNEGYKSYSNGIEHQEERMFTSKSQIVNIESEEALSKTLQMGITQILIFLGENKTAEKSFECPEMNNCLQVFLKNFELAAQNLAKYNTALGIVNCDLFKVYNYCTAERMARFAFGFRKGEEMIAYPLETLYNVDSIIASSLHLSLIDSVPIIQTASERRKLEMLHRGKSDIVFSYQNSLGTREHRIFLEIASKFGQNFRFTLSTYKSGIIDLPTGKEQSDDPLPDVFLWVLQCSQYEGLSSQERGEKWNNICIPSLYRGPLNFDRISTYLSIFLLPPWQEIDAEDFKGSIVPSKTPYNATDLPFALFLYDSNSEKRVKSLLPTISQMLRGSVAIIVGNGKILHSLEEKGILKTRLQHFRLPTLCFIAKNGEEIFNYVNDFDDPLFWIQDQLKRLRSPKIPSDELPPQLYDIEELAQEDELVNSMISQELLTGVMKINGEEELRKLVSSKDNNAVVAFYLPWDPVSNLLLQHLHSVSSTLANLGRGGLSTVHKLDCFEWSYVCDRNNVQTFPKLTIFGNEGRKWNFDAPFDDEEITKFILLFECSNNPQRLHNIEELSEFVKGNGNNCLASQIIESRVIGIFPNEDQINALNFSKFALKHRDEFLFGLLINKEHTLQRCPTQSGCILVSKPADHFQKTIYLNQESNYANTSLLAQLRHHILPLIGPLTPRRHLSVISLSHFDQNEANFHFLFFLPFPIKTLSEEEETAFAPSNDSRYAGRLIKMMAHLAQRFYKARVVFSYVDRDSTMRDSLLEAYNNLSDDVAHLIAVDDALKHATIWRNITYHMQDTLEEEITKVLKRIHPPSMSLPYEEWKGSSFAFDYLKFMEDDLENESDDHFAIEMEADVRNGGYFATRHPPRRT